MGPRRPPATPYRRGPSDIAADHAGEGQRQFPPRPSGGYQSPSAGRPPLRPSRPYAPRTLDSSDAPPRGRQFGPAAARPDAVAQTQSFMAHVVPGLEELASEELERFAGITVGRTIRSMDDRSSIITFTYSGHPSELLGIRVIEDVFAVVATADRVPIGWDGLAAIRSLVARAPDLPSALATFRAIRRTPRPRPSFRVVARMSGDHAFRRLEVQHSVESGLREAGQGWMPGGEDADVEVWVHLMDRTVMVGLRLTEDAGRQRDPQDDRQSSMKPTVAHAMVLLSRPRADDVVLDPMCGVGTIIVERGMHSRYRLLLAGDIDRQAVSATMRTAGQRYRPISVERWDAGTLPLADGSVSAVLTNLPLGRHGGSPQGIATLYQRLVTEWARVVRSGGRMVLLATERDALERIVADDPRLRISRRLAVMVRGLPATIFVLARVAG